MIALVSSLLGLGPTLMHRTVTKVIRNVRLTLNHYANAGAFTNCRIGMTHFSDVLPQLSNLFLKSTVSELLLFMQKVVRSHLFLKYFIYSSFFVIFIIS